MLCNSSKYTSEAAAWRPHANEPTDDSNRRCGSHPSFNSLPPLSLRQTQQQYSRRAAHSSDRCAKVQLSGDEDRHAAFGATPAGPAAPPAPPAPLLWRLEKETESSRQEEAKRTRAALRRTRRRTARPTRTPHSSAFRPTFSTCSRASKPPPSRSSRSSPLTSVSASRRQYRRRHVDRPQQKQQKMALLSCFMSLSPLQSSSDSVSASSSTCSQPPSGSASGRTPFSPAPQLQLMSDAATETSQSAVSRPHNANASANEPTPKQRLRSPQLRLRASPHSPPHPPLRLPLRVALQTSNRL